jgi:hypothetical protein
MARTDYCALVTEPMSEYLAATELERYGLRPYIPQLRRRHLALHGSQLIAKLSPLFPRYPLLPIGDAGAPAIRLASGLRRSRPVLSDDDGNPWRCPRDVIAELMEHEAAGMFDEVLMPGDAVRIKGGALAGMLGLLQKNSKASRLTILSPLFGGVRATVSSKNITRV